MIALRVSFQSMCALKSLVKAIIVISGRHRESYWITMMEFQAGRTEKIVRYEKNLEKCKKKFLTKIIVKNLLIIERNVKITDLWSQCTIQRRSKAMI